MKFNTLEYNESVEEPLEVKPDIEIDIFLEDSLKEKLSELFNEAKDKHIETPIEKTDAERQVETDQIWKNTGPRIP